MLNLSLTVLLSCVVALSFGRSLVAETCDPRDMPQAGVVGVQGMNVIDWLRAQPATYLVLDGGTDDGFQEGNCVCAFKKADGAKLGCGLVDGTLAPPSSHAAVVRFSVYPGCSVAQSDYPAMSSFFYANGIEEADPETQENISQLLYAKRVCIKLPPGEIQLAKAIEIKKDSITLQWSSGLYNESYLVAYAAGTRAPACGGAKVAGDTKYQVTGLKPSTTYSFRICAVNQDGVSTGVTVKAKTKKR